jgi:diphosphomevalonate decarboxylase
MSQKSTVEAPANIALIKYWGARDLGRAIPSNPSLSMTLRTCATRTTVEPIEGATDEVWLISPEGGERDPGEEFTRKVQAQLDHVRHWAGSEQGFRVGTRNSFPSAAGMASSASGFAALTLAAAAALGRRDASREELSALARQSGSGSASRSVFGGFVEWPADAAGERAAQIAAADHWDLRDLIAVVEEGPKEVSSREGHRRAATSPYYPRRLELLPGRLAAVRAALAARDLDTLGPLVEEEAIDLHLIAMSSRPPIFYWSPATLAVHETVRALRRDGTAAWFTMDAGANVHVLCEPAAEDEVARRLAAAPGVHAVLRDGVGPGPVFDLPHLF